MSQLDLVSYSTHGNVFLLSVGVTIAIPILQVVKLRFRKPKNLSKP